MTLCDVAPGSAFTVRTVRTGGEIGKRLADMGFTEGVQGTVIRGAMLRGPVQVRIRGYDLLIRRSEAAVIDVAASSGAWRDARPRRCCESASPAMQGFPGHTGRRHGWATFSTFLTELLGIHRQGGQRSGGHGDRKGSGSSHDHSRDENSRDRCGHRGARS